MPGVFLRHGLELEAPFVNGVWGTVYSVVETIETLKNKGAAPENGNLVVVGVGLNDVIFYPRLPGYRKNWLPGCVVEAIYAARTGTFGHEPLPVFIEKARAIGYYAHLDR